VDYIRTLLAGFVLFALFNSSPI